MNKNIVYLETDPPKAVPGGSAAGAANAVLGDGSAKIAEESYRETEIRVSTPKEKYLVLTYLYRPFWRAYVDRERVPLYRAYGGFMCVQVPAGEHIITFRYYPWDVYLGMFLTLCAMTLPFVARRLF